MERDPEADEVVQGSKHLRDDKCREHRDRPAAHEGDEAKELQVGFDEGHRTPANTSAQIPPARSATMSMTLCRDRSAGFALCEC